MLRIYKWVSKVSHENIRSDKERCLVFAPCRFLNSMSVETSKVHFVANRGGLTEGLYLGTIHASIYCRLNFLKWWWKVLELEKISTLVKV